MYRYVRKGLQSEKDRDGVISYDDIIRDFDAALQKDDRLAEPIRSHLPDKQTWQDGVPFLSALPAPLGCAVGAVMTARELLRQAFIP